MFSHCLDGKKGGGIFAIGEVVEPKIKTTPILDDTTHFNIALDSIDVNGDAVKLPTSIFDFVKKQAAIVDSGTTLAYFPDNVYNQLMEKIKAAQPDNKPHTVEKLFTCYKYSGKFCIISIGLDDLEFVTQRSKESHTLFKKNFRRTIGQQFMGTRKMMGISRSTRGRIERSMYNGRSQLTRGPKCPIGI